MNVNIILAKDAVEGQEYLTAMMKYRVKILKKYGSDTHTSSVLVESETDPFRKINIAPGTELIAYSKEEHVPVQRPVIEPKETVSSKKKEKVSMARTKTPRSVIIDQELAQYTDKSKEVDFEAIATKVIKEGRATEEDRKAVISQSKTRHKWYTEQGKQNPALKKAAS